MTKEEFILAFIAMYRTANASDSDSPYPWTKPKMAGRACCRHLDRMIIGLMECEALTAGEVEDIYNQL